jgi:aspartyl protease family protein
MRFGFFTFIIAVGLFGSILTNGLSRSHSNGDEVFERAKAQQERRYEEAVAETKNRERSDGAVELARDPDGHFYADVQVNGATLHMLVDTGASTIALSREDARSAGLATSIGMPEVVGRGADGDVHGEMATLDRMTLGQKTVEGLPAVVLNSGEQSLLGQSFLSKFDKVQIEGDRMLLQ